MNKAARIIYHRDLWPAACRANRWDPRDQERRRAVCRECMRLVRGPRVTTSDDRFGADETTALFVYLAHLADPASLVKAAAWSDCLVDYKAFNRARNADWHERQSYGPEGSRRLQRERFARRKTAAGEPLESFDPDEIRKRHITTASRHRAKLAKEKKANTPRTLAEQRNSVPPAGSVILLPAPAGAADVDEPELVEAFAGEDPAYTPPAGQPF